MTWPEVYPRDLTKPLTPNDAHLYPWIFKCADTRCHWATAHATQQEADEVRVRHSHETCPLTGSAHHGEGSIVSLAHKMWEQLDEVTRKLMEEKPAPWTGRDEGDAPPSQREAEDAYQRERGKAQGFATCIEILSQPHWNEPGSCAKHALKRYRMKKGQIEFEETPGLAGYNPMPLPARDLAKAKTTKAKQLSEIESSPAVGVRQEPDITGIDDAAISLIENGIKAKLPIKSVAKLAKVTEAQVNAIKRKMEAA